MLAIRQTRSSKRAVRRVSCALSIRPHPPLLPLVYGGNGYPPRSRGRSHGGKQGAAGGATSAGILCPARCRGLGCAVLWGTIVCQKGEICKQDVPAGFPRADNIARERHENRPVPEYGPGRTCCSRLRRVVRAGVVAGPGDRRSGERQDQRREQGQRNPSSHWYLLPQSFPLHLAAIVRASTSPCYRRLHPRGDDPSCAVLPAEPNMVCAMATGADGRGGGRPAAPTSTTSRGPGSHALVT